MLGKPSEFYVGGMTILLTTMWRVALVPVQAVLYGLVCAMAVWSGLAGVYQGGSMWDICMARANLLWNV